MESRADCRLFGNENPTHPKAVNLMFGLSHVRGSHLNDPGLEFTNKLCIYRSMANTTRNAVTCRGVMQMCRPWKCN